MRIPSLAFVLLSAGLCSGTLASGDTLSAVQVSTSKNASTQTLISNSATPISAPANDISASANGFSTSATRIAQTPAGAATLPAASGGIYLTPEHFSQCTLSYPFDCQTSKLKLNAFLGSPNIRVIRNGEKHIILKDTIFGYRDCSGINYRFYKKGPYRILDTAGFFLYSYASLKQGSKIARPATSYYFSTAPSAPILPLTISNLQKAFASNTAFCYKVSTEFRTDDALADWFDAGKTYKLKYAYAQTLK